MKKTKSIILSVEASNRKNIKLFLIVHYFLLNFGVQDKIIDFVSLATKTFKLLCAMLKNVIDKFPLWNKIVALCVDKQTYILLALKGLVKIVCNENLKLKWGERLSVLVVGHKFTTIYYAVNCLPNDTCLLPHIPTQDLRTEKLLWLQEQIMLNF